MRQEKYCDFADASAPPAYSVRVPAVCAAHIPAASTVRRAMYGVRCTATYREHRGVLVEDTWTAIAVGNRVGNGRTKQDRKARSRMNVASGVQQLRRSALRTLVVAKNSGRTVHAPCGTHRISGVIQKRGRRNSLEFPKGWGTLSMRGDTAAQFISFVYKLRVLVRWERRNQAIKEFYLAVRKTSASERRVIDGCMSGQLLTEIFRP